MKSNLVDTTFFNFPFKSIVQNNPVYSGNTGITKIINKKLKISAIISSGFRVPNIDDLAKIFESQPGTLIVPNINLKPENTFNYEIGFAKLFGKSIKWESSIYYTQFIKAISTSAFTFNGQDSILYKLVDILLNIKLRKNPDYKKQFLESYLSYITKERIYKIEERIYKIFLLWGSKN